MLLANEIPQVLPTLPFFGLGSCSCAPEELIRFAISGMDTILGGGFVPSEQLRALGGFTSTSVHLSKTSENGVEESIIFLSLKMVILKYWQKTEKFLPVSVLSFT